MSEGDKAFTGSIPQNYDRFLVPLIFMPYAQDLARRAAALKPAAVLETATGSGVVTRACAALLKAGTVYTATDLNQPMLDYAKAHQTGALAMTWRVADAQTLPFGDQEFDLVLCQFGAMFFPDRSAAYREARRVLRRGAPFIFSVWDRIEDNVFADEVTNALGELFPDDPPRFLSRTPHGYHDTSVIRHELEGANFRDVKIETKAEQSPARSPRHAALAYCQGTPLRNEIEARGGDLEQATMQAARAIEARHGSGEISEKIQAHVITARA